LSNTQELVLKRTTDWRWHYEAQNPSEAGVTKMSFKAMDGKKPPLNITIEVPEFPDAQE